MSSYLPKFTPGMTPYVAAAMLLTAIGSIGQYIFGITDHGNSDEHSASISGKYDAVTSTDGLYQASMVTNMTADLAAAITTISILRQYCGGTLNPEGITFSYTLTALAVVEAITLTTGFGPPYRGDDLKTSAEQFTALCEQLRLTLPDTDTGWQGPASQTYANQIAALQTKVQDLAKVDLDLACYAGLHAETVTEIRLVLGLLKDCLVIGCYIENYFILKDPSPTGLTEAKMFGVLVSGAITVFAGCAGAALSYSSYGTAAPNVDFVTVEYKDLAKSLAPKGVLVQDKVVAAEGSRVSSVAVPGGLAGVVREDTSTEQRVRANAAAHAGENSGVNTLEPSELSEQPDGTAFPSAAPFSMPNPTQWAALSEHAAKLPRYAAYYLNPVKNAGEQGQRPAGPEAAPMEAAPAQAATTSTIDGAFARAGFSHAEPAPVVSAPADQGEQRRPTAVGGILQPKP